MHGGRVGDEKKRIPLLNDAPQQSINNAQHVRARCLARVTNYSFLYLRCFSFGKDHGEMEAKMKSAVKPYTQDLDDSVP